MPNADATDTDTPKRPRRVRVTTELGRPQTLAADATQFDRVGRGDNVLFLGLGPEPGRLPELFPEHAGFGYYVENPAFAAQMPPGWAESIPEGLKPLPPERLLRHYIKAASVFRYRPNIRLFPSFWGPIWARCALAPVKPAQPNPQPLVWLPGGADSLLVEELDQAFRQAGMATHRLESDSVTATLLPRLLRDERPDLFFSVNFAGLDAFGGVAYLLAEAGVKVAVWCVDNPFHLLTEARSRYWAGLDLFVTDDWFIEPLRDLGAQSVHHLPLAAAPGFFSAAETPLPKDAEGIEERLAFVGRSAFPGKAEFFAGCELPPDFEATCDAEFDAADRPDFAWWLRRLEIFTLWPGQQVRRAGLAAEEAARRWRALSLAMAEEAPGAELTVFGDDGWRDLLPEGSDIRRPVDYYTELPAIYHNAFAVLNVTSMLLPHGLTQRHFDVWAAGGLLITDNTRGLNLFPSEMTLEITFARHPSIPAMLERFRKDDALRRDLIASWKELVLQEHTYHNRVETVLAVLGMG